ncbi:MAG: endolytic transglycosylase MltG [Candidatus Paceibacterota bacterium]|jgi:UPF0755 protein
MKKIFFVFIFLSLAGLFLYFFIQFLPTHFGRSAKESFIIAKDISEKDLAVRLEKEGFVRSQQAFEQAIKSKNLQGKTQPGGYYISKSMSVFEIAEILALHPVQKWVTLPEGLRKEEAAEILQKELGWDDPQTQLFLDNSKEGYIFPETYLLDIGWTGKDIAARLSGQFDEEFAVLAKGYDNRLSSEEAVVLASLVQREARGAEEMSLIAGIISNRLDIGMKLDIDSSLQYQAGSPEDWWPKISSADKSAESPYNTYLNKGLPLASICNPGREALQAALFPEKNSYFYYLHDAEGNIHCAKTYEEHLANVNKYLR